MTKFTTININTFRKKIYTNYIIYINNFIITQIKANMHNFTSI